CWAVGPPPHHARRASGCTRPRRPHAARAARSSARVVHRIALIVLLALQKPCIAGSRSRGNNQLKAKLLRPFGQRSDLLLTIPAFVVFGSFINVRLSVFDEPVEQAG